MRCKCFGTSTDSVLVRQHHAGAGPPLCDSWEQLRVGRLVLSQKFPEKPGQRRFVSNPLGCVARPSQRLCFPSVYVCTRVRVHVCTYVHVSSEVGHPLRHLVEVPANVKVTSIPSTHLNYVQFFTCGQMSGPQGPQPSRLVCTTGR